MVKGLIHVLEALEGDTVTIELKNGSVVIGTLVSIDQNMTTYLSGVKSVPVKGEPEHHDELTVRGMNVRMFLLSESRDLDELLKKAEANEKRKQNKSNNNNNNNNNKQNQNQNQNQKGGGGGFKAGGGKPMPKASGARRTREDQN